MADILEKTQSAIMYGFGFYRNELRKYYEEARNNIHFLATILRYFKVNFKTIYKNQKTKLTTPY